MKSSIYNYIFEKGDTAYWYNGIEHSYFKMPAKISMKIRNLMSSSTGIDKLPEVLYQKFLNKGFIVNDDVDELSVIRQKNEEEINRKDYMLTILPTLNCNYKCWYCIQRHIPSKMTYDTMRKVMKHIDYMIDSEKISSLQIEWFGGEPFMYFRQIIKPICEYAIKSCGRKGIPYSSTATTNGYFLYPNVIEDLEELQFKRFHITLDGPQKEHDKVKFQNGCVSAFEHTLRNIESILNSMKEPFILLRINYTDTNLDPKIVSEINNFISPKNRNKILITPKKVWQEKLRQERYSIINNILTSFENSGYRVVRFDIVRNFVPCYSNRKYYNAINYNGDVVKCTACNDLYDKSQHGTIIDDGSVSWSNNYLEKYKIKSFENEVCLSCKYLPICMGICPKDAGEYNYCKLKAVDFDIAASMIDFIEYSYKNS